MKKKNNNSGNIVDEIMISAQLAAALEVSAYPKPGNVHRLRDFPDTRFEHFIAGSVGIGLAIREAASRGIEVVEGKLNYGQLGLGELILKGIKYSKEWHTGGNTHLGTTMLFIPLSISAGINKARGKTDITSIRKEFGKVMRATTVEDALAVTRAVEISNMGGLGKLTHLPDIGEEDISLEIRDKEYTLYQLMKMSSSWDLVSQEMVRNLKIVCSEGYPYFVKALDETGDINIAIVHTFLVLLSKHPDTFIARKYGLRFVDDVSLAVKVGMKKSNEIAKRADDILKAGGLSSKEGKDMIFKLDEDLAAERLNPGTTADITATTIFVALLNGYRP
jgi:triphosphoribosyl-dephospho-CoA synthase